MIDSPGPVAALDAAPTSVTIAPADTAATGCGACVDAESLGFTFTYAFQPIVDVRDRTIFSHEALVRGTAGEGAYAILALVNDGNRYTFDQACRVKALTLAAALGMTSRLNINFLPNAVYRPEACIRTTLTAARRVGFPIDRIMFEVVESERIDDKAHLRNIFSEYHRLGFATAIDDFGAGFANLNLLAEFRPDYIKLDLEMIRDVDTNPVRQAIVRGVLAVCADLAIGVIAEGVETVAEYRWLARAGVVLFQGYLFARPGFESLPVVRFPE